MDKLEANHEVIDDFVKFLLFGFKLYVRNHKLQNMDVAIAINYFHATILLSLEDKSDLDEASKRIWRQSAIDAFEDLMRTENDER